MKKICEKCGKLRECKRRFCSLNCYWESKNGSKLTKEHKEKIGMSLRNSEKFHDSMKSLEFKEKMRKSKMGELNPSKREDVRDKMKLARKQFIKNGGHPWNYKKEFLAVRGLKNGIFTKPHSYKKGKFFSKKNKKEMMYRSFDELCCMKKFETLTKLDIYKYEIDEVPYVDAKKRNRFTIPDFHLYWNDGTEEIIEYKPIWKIEREKIKLTAMRRYCKERKYKFSIWSQKDIQDLLTRVVLPKVRNVI